VSGLTKASGGGGGGGGGGITIQEASGLPSILASILEFPNGSLTMNGTTVSVDKYPEPLSVSGPNLNSFAPYLRAGYTFSGTSGLADSVGVPHSMAAAGTPLNYLVAGHNNDAISWNSGGYFERPPQGFSPGTSEYTLNWWVKVPSVNGTQTLLQWYASSGYAMTLSYHYTGKLYFHDNGNNYSVNNYPLNAWTMITWQRIKDGGVYYNRVFMNGVQEINLVDVTPDLESRSLRVGGTENPATTIIGDELLYYTGPDGYGAISSAAIAELYNSGSGIFLDTVGTPTGLGFNHADLVNYNSYLHDYWKFEESGTPLIDSISNNSLAAVGSPTFGVAGKNNNCLQYVQTNPDYVSRTSSFAHTGSQEFSISYWCYLDSMVQTNYGFGFFTSHTVYEHVRLSALGEIHYNYRSASGIAGSVQSGASLFTAGSWFHIGIVKTETAGPLWEVSLYIDGALVASETPRTLVHQPNANGGSIYVGSGGHPNLLGAELNGKVDELAYWKGIALDSAAVTALYRDGYGRFLATLGDPDPSVLGLNHVDLVNYNRYLTSYWKFEESGTPLIDSISNNSLAATGSPTFGVAGKNGNCFELHSASFDRLSRTSTFAHSADQEYTMSYWVYLNTTSATQHCHEFAIGVSHKENVYINSSNTVTAYRKVGGLAQTILGTTVLAGSTWHHIAIVKTKVGALYQWTLYVNGAFNGSDTADANAQSLNTASSSLNIGAAFVSYPTLYFLNGRMDEVAYWKGNGAALDSAAVTALYNAGAGRFLESI